MRLTQEQVEKYEAIHRFVMDVCNPVDRTSILASAFLRRAKFKLNSWVPIFDYHPRRPNRSITKTVMDTFDSSKDVEEYILEYSAVQHAIKMTLKSTKTLRSILLLDENKRVLTDIEQGYRDMFNPIFLLQRVLSFLEISVVGQRILKTPITLQSSLYVPKTKLTEIIDLRSVDVETCLQGVAIRLESKLVERYTRSSKSKLILTCADRFTGGMSIAQISGLIYEAKWNIGFS